MATMIIRPENKADYSIGHMLEAFTDILSATGSDLFQDIQLVEQDNGLVLKYLVTPTGNEIIKEFNTDQGTPELKADIMEHLFSMLDAAANL